MSGISVSNSCFLRRVIQKCSFIMNGLLRLLIWVATYNSPFSVKMSNGQSSENCKLPMAIRCRKPCAHPVKDEGEDGII
jgi:hypothetical protein